MKKIGCIFLLMIGALVPGYALPLKDSLQNRYFRNISIAQGLSQSTVFTIVQDRLGFIWMGTQDGLNRYDGKTFTTYRPSRTDAYSIQSNFIRCSFIDENANLWIGGDKGLSLYNYNTDKFTNFQFSEFSGKSVFATITQDGDGTIWAGSGDGNIFYRNKAASSFQKLDFDATSLNVKQVNSMACAGDNLWIGASTGLFRFNLKTRRFEQTKLLSIQPHINCLFIEGSYLWIGTEGDGLLRYNLISTGIEWFKHSRHNTNSIADDNVRSINKDPKGNIWIGTFRGLSILRQTTNFIQNYHHSSSTPYTISQNSIRCIFIDKQSGVWLGTYYGGANYYHESDFKFGLLNQLTRPLSLNDAVVNVMAEDRGGNIWIGTNDKGLNFWDRKANVIRYYTNKERGGVGSISSNNIKAIAFDGNGKLLIGTHNNGLNYFDPQTGANRIFKHTPGNPTGISGNMVYSILTDNNKKIWVGTRSGLDRFESQTGTFRHFYTDKTGRRLTSDEITCMIQDSKGRIWIGTINGVNIFHPNNNLFENFEGRQLSNDIVNTISEDAYGRIWAGTRGGLNLFDEESKKFITSARWVGLSGVIYAIVPDDNGMLWVSTNSGLARFNPEHSETQLFNYRYGLQNNQFNVNAHLKTKDGLILFGGINGVAYFYSSEVEQKPTNLKITFTQLDVLNRKIIPGDSSGILSAHIDKIKSLQLAHDSKQFTIYFNTFDFASPSEITYQTRLSGTSNEWQTSAANYVAYSNLSPGRYQLEIRAVSGNGETGPVRKIEIKVLPPWWKRSWFYLSCALIAMAGAFLAYKIISDRIKTHHDLKIERLGKEKLEYVNRMKMEFLTNISHELKTPLTLILAPVEEIIKNPKNEKELQQAHQLILFNAKRLYRLIDQLLDFRKAELGVKKLIVSRQDIVEVLQEAYKSFIPLGEKRNIDFRFETKEESICFCFDRDSVEKIIFNLLSNAFKYTPQGGIVSVAVYKSTDDNVVITITDSGIGIDESNQKIIFERFYQVNNNEINLGSGIGLAYTKSLVELHHGEIWVDSQLGKGARFFVSIPIKDEYYESDEHAHNTIARLSNADNPKTEYPDNSSNINHDSCDGKPAERETILIIDDNHEIVEYLSGYFVKEYHVKKAFDGKEGLEVLVKKPVDIIICDVMMPVMDGIRFCEKVKQNINTSHIPVIMLTAKSDVADHIHGIETGADDYISKPFSISLLQVKIKNILRTRKLLREHYSKTSDIVAEDITFNELDREFINKAIKIVEENITESDISVDKLSRELFMSRSNLYLKLKALTGESASEFIKRIRFKKAIELLQTRKHSMAEIAYMAGFSSPSYFSTAFKQFFKCLPSEYLEKNIPTKGW